MKRFKDDVREVREGFECGIGIENFNDVKSERLIESYRIEESRLAERDGVVIVGVM